MRASLNSLQYRILKFLFHYAPVWTETRFRVSKRSVHFTGDICLNLRFISFADLSNYSLDCLHKFSSRSHISAQRAMVHNALSTRPQRISCWRRFIEQISAWSAELQQEFANSRVCVRIERRRWYAASVDTIPRNSCCHFNRCVSQLISLSISSPSMLCLSLRRVISDLAIYWAVHISIVRTNNNAFSSFKWQFWAQQQRQQQRQQQQHACWCWRRASCRTSSEIQERGHSRHNCTVQLPALFCFCSVVLIILWCVVLLNHCVLQVATIRVGSIAIAIHTSAVLYVAILAIIATIAHFSGKLRIASDVFVICVHRAVLICEFVSQS